MKINELEILVDSIKSLPGVGSKNAKRIAQHIINQDMKYVEQLCNNIKIAKLATKKCTNCNLLTRTEKCVVCTNETRDRKKLCLVSDNEDAIKIEESNAFDGLYYVLWGELSIKNNKSDPTYLEKFLKERIKDEDLEELIIATNPTIDGEMTCEYILKNNTNKKLKITRIAIGLPVNSAIDYADEYTIKKSLENRRKI